MALLLKRNKLNISGIGNIRIMPGINRFTDEQVEEMKLNPAWEEMLTCGVHEIVSKPKAEALEEKADSIADMTVKDAKKVVSETYDVESLNAMIEEEDSKHKRKGIFDSIERQLEKVSSDKTDEEEDDEE